MKYEESMRIVVENSKGVQSFFEVRDKESINEIKRIIGKEKIQALYESFDLSSKRCKCCGNLK